MREDDAPPTDPAPGPDLGQVRVAVTDDRQVQLVVAERDAPQEFFVRMDADMADWLGDSLKEAAATLRQLNSSGGSA